MKELGRPYHFTVTVTTRPIRDHEEDGSDYIFVSEEHFRSMVDANDLLEWANVYGHFYGVPRSQVINAFQKGKDVVMKIDVQGALTLRDLAPGSLLIFLAPPSMEELANRLGERMTESPDAYKRRLETARSEMAESIHYDHVVINHHERVDDTVATIEQLIAKERIETSGTHLNL